LDGLPFHSIREDEAIWVEQAFEEREVFDVVRELNGDRAPRPNGFSMTFFQSCSDVIKDVMKLFLEFHEFGKFVRSLNVTFISLISKKVGAVEIKDFRPINLISGVYKIIVKANRLKFVMEHVISKTPNAFIRDCQILDYALICNEYIDRRLKSGDLGLLCNGL
jgi:hypothetical protein